MSSDNLNVWDSPWTAASEESEPPNDPPGPTKNSSVQSGQQSPVLSPPTAAKENGLLGLSDILETNQWNSSNQSLSIYESRQIESSKEDTLNVIPSDISVNTEQQQISEPANIEVSPEPPTSPLDNTKEINSNDIKNNFHEDDLVPSETQEVAETPEDINKEESNKGHNEEENDSAGDPTDDEDTSDADEGYSQLNNEAEFDSDEDYSQINNNNEEIELSPPLENTTESVQPIETPTTIAVSDETISVPFSISVPDDADVQYEQDTPLATTTAQTTENDDETSSRDLSDTSMSDPVSEGVTTTTLDIVTQPAMETADGTDAKSITETPEAHDVPEDIDDDFGDFGEVEETVAVRPPASHPHEFTLQKPINEILEKICTFSSYSTPDKETSARLESVLNIGSARKWNNRLTRPTRQFLHVEDKPEALPRWKSSDVKKEMELVLAHWREQDIRKPRFGFKFKWKVPSERPRSLQLTTNTALPSATSTINSPHNPSTPLTSSALAGLSIQNSSTPSSVTTTLESHPSSSSLASKMAPLDSPISLKAQTISPALSPPISEPASKTHEKVHKRVMSDHAAAHIVKSEPLSDSHIGPTVGNSQIEIRPDYKSSDLPVLSASPLVTESPLVAEPPLVSELPLPTELPLPPEPSLVPESSLVPDISQVPQEDADDWGDFITTDEVVSDQKKNQEPAITTFSNTPIISPTPISITPQKTPISFPVMDLSKNDIIILTKSSPIVPEIPSKPEDSGSGLPIGSSSIVSHQIPDDNKSGKVNAKSNVYSPTLQNSGTFKSASISSPLTSTYFQPSGGNDVLKKSSTPVQFTGLNLMVPISASPVSAVPSAKLSPAPVSANIAPVPVSTNNTYTLSAEKNNDDFGDFADDFGDDFADFVSASPPTLSSSPMSVASFNHVHSATAAPAATPKLPVLESFKAPQQQVVLGPLQPSAKSKQTLEEETISAIVDKLPDLTFLL